MAEYKRKKVNKFFKIKSKKHKADDNIVMSDKKTRTRKSGIVPENNIKIIRGKKFIQKQKTKIIASVAALVCIIIFILSISMPGGLYENAVNYTALIGTGSYPINISGSSVIDCVSNGSYYYVLTDTNIAAYSNNGKTVFNELHGFANPILSVSSTRAMVYDQGGKLIYFYNLSGKIESIEANDEIITASMSNDGDFAVSTQSDSNASVVKVYNSKFKEVYTWNSAIGIVNNVLVNNAGKRLAITTLNVESGEYNSKLIILDIKKTDNADPLHTYELGKSLPLALYNNGSGISIVCNDSYKFINWKKYKTNEITLSGEINICRNTKDGLMLVFNLANNRNDNTIITVSKKGKIKSEFKTQDFITDIQFNKGRIYLLNDTTITIYNKNGKILRDSQTEYGIKKIAVTSSNSVAAISDEKIIKTNIDKGW